jgi:hypothetical protein
VLACDKQQRRAMDVVNELASIRRARLWKDAMGPASFAVRTNDTDVRAYAHCAPGGGLTVAYINFSGNTTAALQVAGGAQGPLPGSRRLLRALSSRDNATVALNGRDLAYVPGSGALPPLEPAADAGNGPLLLPPFARLAPEQRILMMRAKVPSF